ncbi:MAG: TonB-dependent receptor [Vicinamibacterales bacterium]
MRTALFLLLCALIAAPLHAQSGVEGVVLDASGAPIPNATVTVDGQSMTTGDDGRFSFPAAAPGATIQVSAPGFASNTARPDGTAEVRVTLHPAPLNEAVVVTTSRGADRLSTATATTVVTSAELLNSAGGALDDILRNTPGFSLFRRSSSRVSNPTTQGVTLRGVSGSGASRTLVLADGQPLNDPFGSWVYWNRIPEAAIDRVEVVRGSTGDLYGANALGGVVQVLTLAPNRTRLRVMAEGGSHDTARGSVYGSTKRDLWEVFGSAEVLRTGGVHVVGEESRGTIDARAASDYGTFLVGGIYNPGDWHAGVRVSYYDENRGNGTPVQINTTNQTVVAGEAGGTAAGGAWQARLSGGTQDYFQTFSFVFAGRGGERLTRDQTMPTAFANYSAQFTRALGEATVLVGMEGKRTSGTMEELNYAASGVVTASPITGGVETSNALFGRVSLVPADSLTVVLGARADFWRSSPEISTSPKHSANFISPRASAEYRLSDVASVHGSVYRAHRTPSLNELHRGFSVGSIITNANPELDPERLTGFEGGLLLAQGTTSARVTAFFNQLDGAVTNVTISDPGVTPIIRQRQNTDTLRSTGVEIEADFRPFERWSYGALAVFTRSRLSETPEQPQLEGNHTPQVPSYQFGGNVTYADPRGFTGSMQLRVLGSQYDDDLNVFELDPFAVVDLTLSQELIRGLNVFAAVENLFNKDYDTGRTPLRTVGWPRSFRMGVRVFLP